MSLRIGLVGLGRIVEYGHLPSYRAAGLEIVGGADVSQTVVDNFRVRDDLGLMTTDVGALIASDEVDIVDIATPPGTHAELIRLAVDSGKHVLCQKPLALSLSEADSVVSYARSRGVRLAVNHNLRFMPTNQAIKGWLEAGSIGTPHLATINYRTTLDYGPWRAALEHMVFSEVMVHHLDLVRWWFGTPARIFAAETRSQSSTDGAATVGTLVGTYPFGLVVSMVCDLVNPGDPPSLVVRIDGDRGSIRADGRVARMWSGGDRPQWTETVPDPADVWVQGIGLIPAFAACMNNLIDAVERGHEPLTSGADNLETLSAVFAAHESLASGRAVSTTRSVGPLDA